MAHNVPRTFNGDRQWYRVGVDIAIDVLDASPHELVVTKPPGLASELPRDPAAPSVLTRLRDQGVDAVNVMGGMLAWAAAGLDVVTDDGSTGHVA